MQTGRLQLVLLLPHLRDGGADLESMAVPGPTAQDNLETFATCVHRQRQA